MTSSRTAKKPPRTRKSPEARRAEIVERATAIALADGLEAITLRTLADALGTTGGLIGYYFPSIDELLAEVFVDVAEAELDAIFESVDAQASPATAMRMLLTSLVSDEQDRLGPLWLDAWHAGRRRAALGREVGRVMQVWLERLSSLIAKGVAAEVFTTVDAEASAMRILAVFDGLTVGSVVRGTLDYAPVKGLLVTVAAAEVGVPADALMP